MGGLRSLFRKTRSLSAYGKLPLSREFLRWECTGRGAVAFKEWIDRGASHASAALPMVEGEKRLVFVTETGSLAAAIWDSCDGGEQSRRFPFALFFELPAREHDARPLFLCTALDGAWQHLDQAYRELQGTSSVAAFHDAIASTLAPDIPPTEQASPRWRAWARRTPFADWSCTVAGNDPEAMVRILFRMKNTMARLRRGELGIGDLALRFPIDRRAGVGEQADLWWRLLAAHVGEIRRLPTVVLDVPSAAATGGSVVFVLRSVRGEDFGFLGAVEPQPAVVDFRSQEPLTAVEGYGRFREKLLHVLGTTGATLEQLGDLDFGSISTV